MKDIPNHSLDRWEQINGICDSPSSIINKYLKNIYNQKIFCKFDLEYFDNRAINEMFNNGIYPDYLSVEMHHPEVFSLITGTGSYKSFTIIEGPHVGTKLQGVNLPEFHGQKFVKFLPHIAGPFGDDISGVWMDVNYMKVLIKLTKGGWRDLHARRQPPTLSRKTQISHLFLVITFGFIIKVRHFANRIKVQSLKR